MSDYDALVVPSLWLETGPLVVLEAQAAGLFVLGSRFGGIAELVDESDAGELVEAGDVAAWAASIERGAAAARRLAAPISSHTNDVVAEEMAALYQSLEPHQVGQRMRIALTADPELAVPPLHYGGIERIVDLLARNIAARGHDVTLFANVSSTCPVPLIAWPALSSTRPIDTLRNMATLAYTTILHRYDIVHSFSRIAYLGPLLPTPIPKLMSYQREISPRTTSAAVCLSRGTLEFTAISRHMISARPLAGRWHLVPNAVPLATYTFRERVAADAPLVFLGRVEQIKGPDLAIEIARRAGRRLVIAGNVPNEHRAWFQAFIEPHLGGEQVRYVGPVDDIAKNELLGAAAALLMPIRWEEPFGIVMIESMACGTPVLGFSRGAVPEIVEQGITGFIGKTVDDLVAAVTRLDSLSRRAARLHVEHLYSDDVVTESYLAIYHNMVESRRHLFGLRVGSTKFGGR